jgi:chromosome segregation ATPase
MLLNDFLYKRSLQKTEQYQRRLKFNALVPKTSIYTSVENPFEKEDYIEEIKNVIIKGGTKEMFDDEDENGGEDELKEKNQELEEDIEELEEDIEELEEDNKELEGDIEELEEDNKELEGDIEELEEEENNNSETIEKMKRAIVYVSEKKADGGGVNQSKKDIVFDNLSKEGGTNRDENTKNVVVSFF